MPVPQRVLIETLKRAARGGAVVANDVEARRVLLDGRGAVVGVEAWDRRCDTTLELRAPAVINSSGPWADWAFDSAGPPREWPGSWTLAFNVLLDRPLPARTSVAVAPADGGRTYFLHRRANRTLAGTYYLADAESPVPTPDHVERFLAELRSAVPAFEVDAGDVARVLPGMLPGSGRGAGGLVSRDLIDTPRSGYPPGLFSVVGTKYTTAPASARRVMESAFAQTVSTRMVPTAGRVLEVPDFERWAKMVDSDPERAAALVHRIIEEEGVRSVEDLLLRRTDWGLAREDYREAVSVLERLGINPAGRS